MLDEEDTNDDVLDLTDPIEDEPEEQEHVEQQGDPDAISIEIDEGEPEQESPVIRSLRDRNRDMARRLKELEQNRDDKPVEVGPEPTLDDCDWDQDRFKADWAAWNDRKRKSDERQAQQNRQAEQANERWAASHSVYRAKAAELGVPDYDEAERIVGEALPVQVGNGVIQYFGDKAPAIVLALHRRPDLLEKMVQTAKDDPLKALLDLRMMAEKVSVINKRKTPAPEAETVVRGSGSVSSVGNKTLEKLEAEADKTGDRSRLIAYRAKMKGHK